MTREEILNALSIENITFGGNSRRLAQFFEALDIVTESYTNIGGEWIPCSERLPEEEGKYLATGLMGTVYIAEFHKGIVKGKPVSLWYRSGGNNAHVIAWMPLPTAYKGE